LGIQGALRKYFVEKKKRERKKEGQKEDGSKGMTGFYL
jgi:hypothetical protein